MVLGRQLSESPSAYPDFDAYARAMLARRLDQVAMFLLAATLGLWPLDFLFADEAAGDLWQRAGLRAVAGAVCLALILATRRSRSFVRYAEPIGVLAACLAFFGIAFYLAGIGGPGSHQFGTVYFCSMMSALAVVPLPRRVVAATAISVCAFAGFMVREPHYLYDAHTPPTAAHMAFTTAFSVLFGHFLYRASLANFEQAHELDARRAQLEELNAELETRVREKTRDIRALLQRIEAAIADERAHLAREIHDQLGQELTALRFTVAFAAGRVADSPPPVRNAIMELDGLLDRTRRTMKRLLDRLRPVVLDELGLSGAARWLAEDFATRSGCKVTVEVAEVPDDFEPRRAGLLFGILQEALTNVGRHARAASVVVRIALLSGQGEGPDQLVLNVCDDGVGLPGQGAGSTGLGLISIRERAEQLGGEAKWGTCDVGGTCLDVRVPITGPG